MNKLFSVFVVAGIFVMTAPALQSRQSAGTSSIAEPTFTRDVAPIFYRNCVVCHRPGENAPMSLLTYSDARPWVRAIDRAVAEGTMPPWHAAAANGTFENERKLTGAEKDIIHRWASGGAPQGALNDLPAMPSFADGWRIGQPDAVFSMAEDYAVPASGTIQYEYFYIPSNFTEAKWVQAIEVRPGNRKLVHHVLVRYQAPPSSPATPSGLRVISEHQKLPPPTRGVTQTVRKFPIRLLATYAPGTDPQALRPGTALKLEPGGVFELQMHYTANGTAGTDRTKIGLIFAKEPPQHEVRANQFFNAALTIPPGASDHRVDTELGFLQDAIVWGIFPHTHVRGKRWEYTIAMPDGTERPLLSVPRYDFNWQTYYMFREPIALPKGARILSSAWYDNSTANRANPDPAVEVKWGDQTWEEMQYTGILYSLQ
jgi:hypothetical protein